MSNISPEDLRELAGHIEDRNYPQAVAVLHREIPETGSTVAETIRRGIWSLLTNYDDVGKDHALRLLGYYYSGLEIEEAIEQLDQQLAGDAIDVSEAHRDRVVAYAWPSGEVLAFERAGVYDYWRNISTEERRRLQMAGFWDAPRPASPSPSPAPAPAAEPPAQVEAPDAEPPAPEPTELELVGLQVVEPELEEPTPAQVDLVASAGEAAARRTLALALREQGRENGVEVGAGQACALCADPVTSRGYRAGSVDGDVWGHVLCVERALQLDADRDAVPPCYVPHTPPAPEPEPPPPTPYPSCDGCEGESPYHTCGMSPARPPAPAEPPEQVEDPSEPAADDPLGQERMTFAGDELLQLAQAGYVQAVNVGTYFARFSKKGDRPCELCKRPVRGGTAREHGDEAVRKSPTSSRLMHWTCVERTLAEAGRQLGTVKRVGQ